jgi:hypothetical protein
MKTLTILSETLNLVFTLPVLNNLKIFLVVSDHYLTVVLLNAYKPALLNC